MPYINDTEENIKVRTGNLKNYIWKTIRPGEIVELPQHTAEAAGLTEVKDEKAEEKDAAELDHMELVPAPVDDKKKTSQLYKKKLESINGIGKKTAEDIIKMYPDEGALIDSLLLGGELPIRDDLSSKIKKKFKIRV